MATLANTYSWASDESALKAYLGIVGTSEDAQLECWYEVAIELGDAYLSNPFTDEDGNDTTHPKKVVLGLYEFVRILREQAQIKFGFGAIKEGDVQINYLLTLVRDYFQSPIPPNVRTFWFPCKKCLLR